MAESLRILILEDNPADAELEQFELKEPGLVFHAKVVMTEKDFVSEIQNLTTPGRNECEPVMFNRPA